MVFFRKYLSHRRNYSLPSTTSKSVTELTAHLCPHCLSILFRWLLRGPVLLAHSVKYTSPPSLLRTLPPECTNSPEVVQVQVVTNVPARRARCTRRSSSSLGSSDYVVSRSQTPVAPTKRLLTIRNLHIVRPSERQIRSAENRGNFGWKAILEGPRPGLFRPPAFEWYPQIVSAKADHIFTPCDKVLRTHTSLLTGDRLEPTARGTTRAKRLGESIAHRRAYYMG